MHKSGAFPLLLLTLSALAHGAEGDGGGLSEEDLLADVPTVLTASRLEQPVSEAPAAMTVIDRQMIRDSGAWDITDVLRLVPGMYVGNSADKGAFVPNATVSYHGLADSYSRRMQVLVDGRSIYTPLFGGPIWSALPVTLDEIERIEVVRGPASAAYGANSFLGVINIITRSATDTQGQHVSLAGGTPGLTGSYRYGGRQGDLDYRITLGYVKDKGVTDTPDQERGRSTVYPRHDDKYINTLAFRGEYQINDLDSLEAQLGLSVGQYQAGVREDPGSGNLNPERENRLQSQYAMLKWQRSDGPDRQLSLRFYHNRDSLDMDVSRNATMDPGLSMLPLPAPYNSPLSSWAERDDFELQHTFAPTENTRLVWGGGFRLDRVSDRLYLGTSDPRNYHQSDLFANLEWRPWHDLVMNGGLMVENNSYNGTHASPRLAANYRFLPGQTVRLGLSKATHSPVILEEAVHSQIDFTPCPSLLHRGNTCSALSFGTTQQLDSENIYSREIGYLWEINTRSSLDLKYSLDHLDHLIETTRYLPSSVDYITALFARPGSDTGKAVTFVGGGEADVRSLEAQLKWYWGEKTRIYWSWAYTKVNGQSVTGNFNYGESTPRHTSNLLVAQDLGTDWTLSLSRYDMDRVRPLSDGDALPGYFRWDGKLAKRFRDSVFRGEVALTIQNMGNRAYQEFFYENQYSRRAFLSLTLDF